MGILSFIVTLFWGILAGIVVTILVVYLINELMDTPKWLVGLIGLFLLFFLSFQFTAIIGAGKVKGVVEDITGLSNTVSGKVDWNNIETTYPVLKPYLDKVGTKVDEVSDQKTSALSLINSIINGFMWRRAAWALGGVMICFVVAALPALTGNVVIDRDNEGRQLLPVIGLRSIRAVRIVRGADKDYKKTIINTK